MSTRARLVNLLIAAVIAVVAIVLIATSSGEDEREREATATPAATKADSKPSKPTPEPTPTPEPVPSIRYEGGKVIGGVKEIEVDQGERVRFDVTSDVAEEIHVHAYDIYRDLVPGKPARVAFDADITGVIEVELHGAGEPIAELRVNP